MKWILYCIGKRCWQSTTCIYNQFIMIPKAFSDLFASTFIRRPRSGIYVFYSLHSERLVKCDTESCKRYEERAKGKVDKG